MTLTCGPPADSQRILLEQEACPRLLLFERLQDRPETGVGKQTTRPAGIPSWHTKIIEISEEKVVLIFGLPGYQGQSLKLFVGWEEMRLRWGGT